MSDISAGNDGLNSEICKFADSLPYWMKYLCSILLADEAIGEKEVETASIFFLQEAGLVPATDKPPISISLTGTKNSDYKKDLFLSSLRNIQGVNALVENQHIAFHPKLTVLYGINGSGKSGYIRLLKKAFHSRNPEDILKNIYIETGHKAIKADIDFTSQGEFFTYTYPDDVERSEFRQFSIFDNKSVHVHLNNKNAFEFRPSGLGFFADLIDAVKRVEDRLELAIVAINESKDYSTLFDEESAIKEHVKGLSAATNLAELKKLIPITEDEKQNRIALEEKKAQLQTLKKDKEIEQLNEYIMLLSRLKASIETNNTCFTSEQLTAVYAAIADLTTKESIAKQEGIDNFKTHRIANVGSPEWKGFVEAARAFAVQQGETYPDADDFCILCQQPLSDNARKLINAYWVFIKSQAEQDVKAAQVVLNGFRVAYAGLKFDLLPEDSVLTKWLGQAKETTDAITGSLEAQNELAAAIVSDIDTRSTAGRQPYQVDTSIIDKLVASVTQQIQKLEKEDPAVELKTIQDKITLYNHKEKLEQHITHIEEHVKNLLWVDIATKAKAKISKKKITDKEKELSAKYFNEAYIEAFNNECEALNCDIGIDVTHTGSAGTSYRQLSLKGLSPVHVLSEGEQKIISLSDFLAEMRFSEITRGIIFDDPVTSLDNERKTQIARRLVEEATKKQVVVFTHDLVFVSVLISMCEDLNAEFFSHWIEKGSNGPGHVFLNNAPSHDKKYRNATIPREHYKEANKAGCPPEQKEFYIKNAFAALRTCYEVFVISDLFSNVVQRFNDRVSVDSIKNVYFTDELAAELHDNFSLCCRYMEGHTHSDAYAYQKPTLENLNEEINRYEALKKKVKDAKKAK